MGEVEAKHRPQRAPRRAACESIARRVVLAASLGATLISCAEERAPTPSLVRLIELAETVDIDTQHVAGGTQGELALLSEDFDEIALSELNLHDALSLRAANLKFPPSPPEARDRLVGEGSARHLVAAQGSLLAMIADVESATAVEVSMRLWTDSPKPPHVGAFVLEELPSREQLDRPQDVLGYAVGRPLQHLTPITTDAERVGQLYRCVIDPLRDARGLLLLVWGVSAELHIDDVIVKPVLWSEEPLLEAAGRSDGVVQAVTVGLDRRRAFVLASGSTLRCEVRLPGANPIFRCSLAASQADLGSGLDVRIAVRVEGEEPRTWSANVPGGASRLSGAWHEVEIDLTGLDEREAVFQLSVDGGSLGGVAFGEPVVLSRSPSESLPPDVVLISLDTVRADRLSLYGFQLETSPHLSQLATESCVFDNCIASSSWTLPSHVTLLTGQLPPRHGVRTPQQRIDSQHSPLLPIELRQAGYQTLGFTGGGFVDPRFGFSAGFDSYGTRDVGLPLQQFVRELVGVPNAERREILGEAPLEEVLDLLRQKQRSRPRFVFLHSYVAHTYLAQRQDLIAVGAREDELDFLTSPGIVSKLRGENAAAARALERSEEDTRQVRLLYDATLRRADRIVGEVVAALEEAGRLDQTYIIVTSDHGEALLEHGFIGHRGNLGESVIRVPLLVRGPGVRAGRISDVVSIADIAPTLRAALDLPTPEAPTDGRNLMPLLTGARQAPQPALAVAGGETASRYALRGERWKLMALSKGDTLHEPRLFDLAEDSAEQVDRSAQETELSERLQAALQRRIVALEAGSAGIDTRELDPDLLEELRAIGYVIDG